MKRRLDHIVGAGVRFEDERSFVPCVCGAEFSAPTPEEVAAAFARHRGEAGAPNVRSGLREDPDGPGWKRGGNQIKPPRTVADREKARRYYARNRDEVLDRARSRYQAGKGRAA